MMTDVHRIGIICEDETDFMAIKELIKRLTGINNLSYKSKHNNGCTHIKSKGARWARELYDNGCHMLIVVHDRDREEYSELLKLLEDIFKDNPFEHQYICIAVEEIEAWFLADPDMIKNVFKLNRKPKPASNPENMDDPKGWLKKQVRSCSDGEATYLNTDHNQRLAKEVSLDLLTSKCPSFEGLANFVANNNYI